MKKIALLCLALLPLLAISPYEVQSWFNKQEYKKVCTNAVENLFRSSGNEAITSLYGMSCLKIHEIDKLTLPIALLSKSEAGRENAAYFADILFKKKLLYHALLDSVDISYIRLPKSDYILSFIFDKFVKKQYVEEYGTYIFEEKNSDIHYELSLSDESQAPKMILKIFQDNNLKSQIEYR